MFEFRHATKHVFKNYHDNFIRELILMLDLRAIYLYWTNRSRLENCFSSNYCRKRNLNSVSFLSEVAKVGFGSSVAESRRLSMIEVSAVMGKYLSIWRTIQLTMIAQAMSMLEHKHLNLDLRHPNERSITQRHFSWDILSHTVPVISPKSVPNLTWMSFRS